MSKIIDIKNDQDFRVLIKYLYENPFNIIGVSDYEIRHSKVIAWLLDHSAGHDLSDFVFMHLLGNIRSNNGTPFNVSDTSDIKIETEWVVEDTGEKIDIVGVSDANKLVIVIENKVKESQRVGQLSSYRKAIEAKYPDYTYYPYFLSLFGDAPNEESDWYMALSYSNVLRVLVLLLRAISNGMYEVSPRINSFIEDYKHTISKHIYLDEKIIKLGESLFKKYKSILDRLESYKNDFSKLEFNALRIIQDHMKSVPNFYFQMAYTKFLRLYSEDEFEGERRGEKVVHFDGFQKGRTEFWFVPVAIFHEQDQKMSSLSWKSPVPFAYFFLKEANKIYLHVELGPVNFLQSTSKASNRAELVKYIKEDHKHEWSDLSPRGNTQKWVKLFSDSREVSSWSSIEAVFLLMEDLYYNSFSKINEQVFALINELFDS